MEKVIIEVLGGVAYVKSSPKNIEVEIRDYDTDGVDEDKLKEDEDGSYFHMSSWIYDGTEIICKL
jgi:hypothetical protein